MTNLIVGLTTMISGGAVGIALLFTLFNISGESAQIVYGSYAVPHGTVHYRACIPKQLEEGKQYPSLFLAPGYTIQHDRWTPHCVLLAERDYITMMIDRPGSKYSEWLTEVEEGIAFLKSMPFTDDNRVDAMGSSFGNQAISYYALLHPDEIQGYINDSGYNNPWVMQDSLAEMDVPTLILSGGGEYRENIKDCDRDGYTWTTAFTEKLLAENAAALWKRIAYDQKTWGCTRHGFLWFPELPATQDAVRQILDFLEVTVGKGPA
jgi:pimeloyl-ACP methyl ester carboxylesterase